MYNIIFSSIQYLYKTRIDISIVFRKIHGAQKVNIKKQQIQITYMFTYLKLIKYLF